MPSPLAHGVIGYTVYRSYGPGPRLERAGASPSPPLMAAIAIGLSLLPDADVALGLLLGDIGAYHNRAASSLLVGAGVSFLIATLAWRLWGTGFRTWLVLSLLCYGLHLLADFLTWGRGVMLFWPLSQSRFSSPVPLFYGFHWSDGLLAGRHALTLLTELAFAGIVYAGLRRRSRGPAPPVRSRGPT